MAKRNWKDKDAEHSKTLDQPTEEEHTYFNLGIALLFTIIGLYLYHKAILSNRQVGNL